MYTICLYSVFIRNNYSCLIFFRYGIQKIKKQTHCKRIAVNFFELYPTSWRVSSVYCNRYVLSPVTSVCFWYIWKSDRHPASSFLIISPTECIEQLQAINDSSFFYYFTVFAGVNTDSNECKEDGETNGPCAHPASGESDSYEFWYGTSRH